MSSAPRRDALGVLNNKIIQCRKCPRLVKYRETVARVKRRSFADWTYWGRPVPGFGDPRGELLILGLAPAAHGGNRTGRVFTGDRSGDFLYAMLHRAGLANQPTSTHAGDGLTLRGAYVAAVVRCAPPDNKPLPSEADNCRPYAEEELDLLRPRAVLTLGAFAFQTYLRILKDRGVITTLAAFPFHHGVAYSIGTNGPRVFASYHPSQRNTFTGTLTEAMFLRLLRQIQKFLVSEPVRV